MIYFIAFTYIPLGGNSFVAHTCIWYISHSSMLTSPITFFYIIYSHPLVSLKFFSSKLRFLIVLIQDLSNVNPQRMYTSFIIHRGLIRLPHVTFEHVLYSDLKLQTFQITGSWIEDTIWLVNLVSSFDNWMTHIETTLGISERYTWNIAAKNSRLRLSLIFTSVINHSSSMRNYFLGQTFHY